MDDALETPTKETLRRKEFNRNRKIVLKNVPGITVEVMKGRGGKGAGRIAVCIIIVNYNYKLYVIYGD